MINKFRNFPIQIMGALAVLLLFNACEKDMDLHSSERSMDNTAVQTQINVEQFVEAILATRSYPDGITVAEPAIESRSDLSIAQYLAFKPELSSLLAAVNRLPELADALSDSEVQVTIFAPTNDAFAALLNAAGFASLDDVPDDVLMGILGRHVLDGFKGIPELDMYEETMQMVKFEDDNEEVAVNIYIEKFGSNAAVINGGAAVIRANQFVGRSIIHFTGQVIPASNLGVLIDDNPNFSIFNAAVDRDDLDTDFIQEMMIGGPFTVFVPTNAAFQKRLQDLGLSSLDDISGAQLTRILRAHVLMGNFRANELSMGVEVASS